MRGLAFVLVAFVAGCGGGSTTVSTSSTPPSGDGSGGAPTPGGGGTPMPGGGGGGMPGGGGGAGGSGGGGIGGGGGGGSAGGGGPGTGGGGVGTCSATPTALATGLSSPRKIAVDTTDVYYIDAGGDPGLYRVAKAGGAAHKIAAVRPFGQDTYQWDVIVNDDTIFLMDSGRIVPLESGSLQILDKSGTLRQTVLPVEPSPCSVPILDHLARDGATIYWSQSNPVKPEADCSDRDNYVLIESLAPGASTPVVDVEPDHGGGVFTVDSSHIFWADAQGIWRVPHTGGLPEKLATGIPVNTLITDSNWLYGTSMSNVWAITAPNEYHSFWGSGPVIASDSLALDDVHLYFGTSSGVRRANKDGSANTLITGGAPSGVVVDATSVYYFSGGALVTECK